MPARSIASNFSTVLIEGLEVMQAYPSVHIILVLRMALLSLRILSREMLKVYERARDPASFDS